MMNVDVAQYEYYLMTLLHALRWFLASVGVLIIVMGGIVATYMFFTRFFLSRETDRERELNDVRRELGLSIVLGLEFILAADVILTIVLPDYYNLGLLAILVVIRTILNYFLDKELMQLSGNKD